MSYHSQGYCSDGVQKHMLSINGKNSIIFPLDVLPGLFEVKWLSYKHLGSKYEDASR
jgi:hypothetical protein